MRGVRRLSSNPRSIVFLAAPGTQILDVAGPYQVFVRAAELFVKERPGVCPYRVSLASTTSSPMVRTNCGLWLRGQSSFRKIKTRIDTLLVAGGSGLDEAARDKDLLRWLRSQATTARRFGSICTGAFLLAAAGLLDGKKATTHWKWAAELAARCQHATIDPDPIFIRDGNLYTTAGITAGMDLALALVEEDLGAPLALRVAREMVLYLRRPGGQSQFSAALGLQSSDCRPIAELQAWVVENLRHDLAVDHLADRCRMSPRNFARIFRNETGLTPSKYVERVRVEAVRRRLEETDNALETIARDCGFGSADSLRRSFGRLLHIAPRDYRSRFSRRAELHNVP
jgi:transcriptional regulator GlxA family with amidase domain